MRFVLKRLALFVVALFGLSVVVFAALRILPGDVASVMAGVNSPPERVTQLREQLGLNRPLIAQYFDWMSALARGDFGTSILTGRSVTSLVGARASITFPLIILGLLIALAIGLPLGCAAVLARSATVRAVFHVLAIVGGAVPALWGGLLLILLFGRGVGLLDVFPSQGFPLDGWGAPGSAISALVLPAVSVGIIVGASLMRYTRAALGDLASSGYIDMARSCGMTRTQAVLRVGLRLATPQLVSVIGLTFASMVTGVMVIENLFALPGIGNGLVTDVGNRDLIAVQSELFLLTAFFLTVGLVVDLLHRVLDPRLKNRYRHYGGDRMSNVRRATTGGRRAAFVIVLHSMWRRAEGKFALIVLALWLLIAIVSLFWTPQSLWATDGYHVWAKPSAEHWLGTDGTGADVFSWLLAGSHTNLVIVLLTVVASMAWGLLLIAAMVARNAALASSSVVVVDALISVPTVLIALILAVPLGASIAVIVIACGFGYGLNLARVARPAALLAARSSYVESALANGASGWRVLISHVMPNILPVLAVQLSLSAGTAVLAESGLTYLGIGVPSGVPSWGHSLATSVKLINVFPLTVVWPGLIVTVVVVALNIFGDVLRDAIDPVTNPALREIGDER